MFTIIIIIVLAAQNIICASLKYMKEELLVKIGFSPYNYASRFSIFVISFPTSTIMGKHATLHVL